jgi:hypothetical protein
MHTMTWKVQPEAQACWQALRQVFTSSPYKAECPALLLASIFKGFDDQCNHMVWSWQLSAVLPGLASGWMGPSQA